MSQQRNTPSKRMWLVGNADISALRALSFFASTGKRALIKPSNLLYGAPPFLLLTWLLVLTGLSILAGALIVIEMQRRWPKLPLPTTLNGAIIAWVPSTAILAGVLLLIFGLLFALEVSSKALGLAHDGLESKTQRLAAEREAQREADLLAGDLPEAPLRSRTSKRL